jgi:hypothetical protein
MACPPVAPASFCDATPYGCALTCVNADGSIGVPSSVIVAPVGAMTSIQFSAYVLGARNE